MDDLKALEKQWWDEGKPYATSATLRRIWGEGGTLYEKERDNGVLGEPRLETLSDQVRDVIASQTKA